MVEALDGRRPANLRELVTPLDTEVAIETPEHIVFHYRVAGPARRALAQLIDLLLCYGVVAVLATTAILATVGFDFMRGNMGFGVGPGIAVGFVLILLFIAQWIYFVVWEAIYARSPGKMALGLRVMSMSGRPIGWQAAALRNLLRAADLLPIGYVVGAVVMTSSSRFQRLGDLVAGTMVVIPDAARAARPLELSPPADPRELASLPDDITLPPEERVAIELFLRRRSSLGVAREHELASMIAQRLGDRLGYVHDNPSRLLALVYDRAVNAGRSEAPPSLIPLRGPR